MRIGLPAVAFLLSVTPIFAESPFQCTANAGSLPLVRGEGYTELAGDFILSCTGGTPTAAGQPVPQATFTIVLTTNVTSRLLSLSGWTDALLIVDEPHNPVNATVPLLNCGSTNTSAAGLPAGATLLAPDNGPSGAGVCEIYSDGNPADTYNPLIPPTNPNLGTTSLGPTAGTPDGFYGWGRPNVYQAQTGTVTLPGSANALTWNGVPVDPPGATATRTFRFTNIRVNATVLGLPNPPNFLTTYVQAFIAVIGNTSMQITNNPVDVGLVASGLSAATTMSSSNGGLVTLTEGFQDAWKARNIAVTLANSATVGGVPQIAQYDGYPAAVGATANNPSDFNQNVPGALYYTEAGFQNNTLDPSGTTPSGGTITNPPAGTFGGAISTVTAVLNPFSDANGTGIAQAGISDSGTRLALQFVNLGGAMVSVPQVVSLYNGNSVSGVMVLTNTDLDGAGAFSLASGTLTAGNNLAVYEVLFSDPFAVESANVPFTLSSPVPGLQILPGLAPFYSSAAAEVESATLPLPRFGALYHFTTTTASPASVTFSPSAQNVTLSAIVTSAGETVNSGTVSFIVPPVNGPPGVSATVTGGNASAQLTIPAGTPANQYQIQAAYSGSAGSMSFMSSSDNSQVLIISKATPTITWTNPAAIQFGSALGPTQLNATASVPGTFVYTPPAGTVLPVGNNQTLSVTFTPTDSTDYNSTGASVLINVNPASNPGTPQLTVTHTLSRGAGNIVVATVTIANSGTGAATNVELTLARIGATSTTTSLPVAVGTIPAGSSAQFTVQFPASVGTSGAISTLSLGGTYTGGSFSSTARITLP